VAKYHAELRRRDSFSSSIVVIGEVSEEEAEVIFISLYLAILSILFM